MGESCALLWSTCMTSPVCVATSSLHCQLRSLFPASEETHIKEGAWDAEFQDYACVCMYVCMY